MAKCVVFGGTGFIGTHLVAELVARGHDVTTYGRGQSTIAGTTSIIGDFLDSSAIADAVDDAQYVFHLISLTTPATADRNPFIDIETNVRMTISLLEACARAGTKRVIFTSTGGAIYGPVVRDHHSEDDRVEPVSPYAIGKSAIENYLRYYQVSFGLDSLVLRIANVYGEGQLSRHGLHGVVGTFLSALRDGRELLVFGDGTMVRDYIYVGDLVRFMASSFDRPDLRHNLYNVGSGRATSVLDIVDAVTTCSGITPKIRHLETPASFVQRAVLDCSRAEREFGPLAPTPLAVGIERTWEYIKSR